MRYLFEDFTLDTDLRELHRGTAPVSIAPQVFDLLDYLISNRERVVSKDDLINAVWNGRIVTESALATRVNAARTAIGDSGEKQRLIKTLARKGYRFVGGVRNVQSPPDAAATADSGVPRFQHGDGLEPSGSTTRDEDVLPTRDDDAISPAPPRLSIVVLPFVNLSSDHEQDYFVDGVTENLTTDMSRISGAFVIARNTAFSYKMRSVDVRQIGRELNVRYVLEGSVQPGGNRIRVNVQLIDAASGRHLWAERFEKPVADLFDMQDEIVARIARSLDAQLVFAEAGRAERSPHPDAMDLYFQGMASVFRGPTAEHLTQARALFERALASDPSSVQALTAMAFVDVTIATDLLTDNRAALLSAAETNATKALALAPDHAEAHLILGYVYVFTNRAARGMTECERALSLNSNLANAHSGIGLAKLYMGRAADTEGHILEALRLSPRDVAAYWWMYCAAMAKLQLCADAEAVAWLRRSIETNRNYPLAHLALAAALGLLGALDEARAAVKVGLALNPGFSIHRFRTARSSDHPSYLAWRERLYEGLRLAGVPEE